MLSACVSLAFLLFSFWTRGVVSWSAKLESRGRLYQLRLITCGERGEAVPYITSGVRKRYLVYGGRGGEGDMSLFVSSSSPHLEQISVDVSKIGIRSSLVSDVARKLAAQALDPGVDSRGALVMQVATENYMQRNVESAKELKVACSKPPVAIDSSAEMASSGLSSVLRIEDGVAEFRGPTVHGLVRFAHVNDHESKIEARFDGLTPGPHSWSVNEYGDVRDGAASTGLPYAPYPLLAGTPAEDQRIAGMLETLVADSTGHAEYSSKSSRLAVWDIIGRSVVLYQSSHQELQNAKDAVACAVIARSSAVGNGCARQLCSCDGTVIWQSSR